MPGIDPPVPYQWQVADIANAAVLNAQLFAGLTFLLQPPLFYGYQSSAQSIPNDSFTSVTINTELIDSENGHSTSSNTSRYVAQRAGWYQVEGSVSFTGNTSGFRGAKLLKNGGTVTIGSEQLAAPVSGFGTTVFCSQFVNMAVGDYVELQAYQNSGAALNTATNSGNDYVTFLRLRWISA